MIIGLGTASEVYQHTASSVDFETIVIGPRGLWANMPARHPMGQPPHLLALSGQGVPAFQAPTGKTVGGLEGFLDVRTYQDGLARLGDTNQSRNGRREFPHCKVTRIIREGGKIHVEVTGGHPHLTGFEADQVIIATGIGPQKQPTDAGIENLGGTPDNTLGYVQVEEGIDYLAHPERCGNDVVVYGGGPTGAWVAAEVASRAREMGWMARVEGSGFNMSKLPGDRNALILSDTKHQVRYDILSYRYVPQYGFRAPTAEISGYPETPKVELMLRGESGFVFPYYADQLIYCIGGNPGASGSVARMLDENLVRELEPLKDNNRTISDGSGTLAWATSRRDLFLIGSATYNFQSSTFQKQAQKAPMAWLPASAQVPDGIAMAVASIEALNQYMPARPAMGGRTRTYVAPNYITADRTSSAQPEKGSLNPVGGQLQTHVLDYQWDINFNTSNRTQLAAFLASTTDLDPFVANLSVALIVYLRSQKLNTFGLNPEQVNYIIDSVSQIALSIRRQFPDFEQSRRERETNRHLGADWVLETYVNLFTAGDYWKGHWTEARINS